MLLPDYRFVKVPICKIFHSVKRTTEIALAKTAPDETAARDWAKYCNQEGITSPGEGA